MDNELHVHIHVTTDTTDVLARLTSMENTLSDNNAALSRLTDAIGAANDRVVEDVAHLQELLDQALATDATDAATIASLREDAAATFGRIEEATASLSAIDPLESFPPAEEPPAEA